MPGFSSSFRGRLLSEITREIIAEVGEVKRKETSPSTANHYLATRAILRRATLDWEWIEPEQVKMLLDELPEHLVDLVKSSPCTGLRKRNVTDLEWSQVDLQRNAAWIHADQAKGRENIHVSLNVTAIEILRKQIGKHPVRIFTYRGKPINQVNTKAWRRALEQAGIEDFRWHDLRHTWASWLTQKGIPLNVIQEMSAWESTEMVKRYAHLAPEQFRKHAIVVDELLNNTILTQSGNQESGNIT
ncbi:MAG: site-specific integrase [Nitrosomonas sp.]|nr:MAG: site-specific integrase [Nitrosomonas sp.]